ncbi:MAG: hypothetical protein M3083_18650 [Actinomycetota bacterium]|nr:hypothetical protein [Actinomycetota bacterium]
MTDGALVLPLTASEKNTTRVATRAKATSAPTIFLVTLGFLRRGGGGGRRAALRVAPVGGR